MSVSRTPEVTLRRLHFDINTTATHVFMFGPLNEIWDQRAGSFQKYVNRLEAGVRTDALLPRALLFRERSREWKPIWRGETTHRAIRAVV